jgi:hypothetical protein
MKQNSSFINPVSKIDHYEPTEQFGLLPSLFMIFFEITIQLCIHSARDIRTDYLYKEIIHDQNEKSRCI